ncbi:Ras-related GTP-binding protein [Nostoc linckia z18]|jgi:small GTP-binding protein|uniref:Ras-related GTP-binding protein n=3 Tax=Nostoc linckia TaxID=92942 RepID=A0A9Q5ZEE6_NOSLI|nr:Ras-related GTP-binding protein [Nostoc linckia z1]PHJ68864.1 Ras-related GTP-binding protein [Nostoc linckia z3]PHJ74515.1 Ras-related GTP-binding protein [Nostoc linckia z2]PHJ87015.1 Ras-related GTP-binding protein [Nostoc linckia z4]PHJ88183.1 Ras-related GTP-binding protein [Nostoc linckia z6]PHJ94140.1 Ras-related GTP-binding protein [Nostoc linckia z7]PHK05086.1 Ras-related GTP-binding protein [Nostoc linckia z8]PHK06531.1 Ras-related GTP-binding protein [Nostoc linckia z9]PHK0916
MVIQKKICMIGAFATGKTSLVSQFVHSIFSDKYHTTVGVKIDKKTINIEENKINLILWDLYGEDEFQKVRMSYLRGCAGYLLVVDGTRRNTLEIAFHLQTRVEDAIGKVPFILVMNKYDITDEWEIEPIELDRVIEKGWTVIKTSAKNGLGVEEVFQTLARKILDC